MLLFYSKYNRYEKLKINNDKKTYDYDEQENK